MAAPLPKVSALERAIAYVSPSWALSRHQARSITAAAGGYAGAGYSERLAYWQPGNADADGAIASDLRELRNRSRDLVRNAPIATGAIETQVAHVVGTGLSMQSRVDTTMLGLDADAASAWQAQAEREFKLWCESTYCDATEEQDFYELQDLVFRSQLESGDCFSVLTSVPRAGWPYRLAIQIIEADRACNPQLGPDTETLVQGIERSASGAPVAVHFCDRHPGRRIAGGTAKWTRVPIRGASGRLNVIHLKRKLRPGQTRGVPCLAPIISMVKQLDRFSTAEVDAAVNSAAMSLFVKMDPTAFGDLFDDDSQTALVNSAKRWDGSLKAGAAVNLLPGEDITSPTPGRPNPEFDPFFNAVVKQIGVALNMPFEVLMKHFNASYSASRAALLDAWRTFRARRVWLAAKFCQPIYEEFLAEAISLGRISAPGFFADPAIRKAWCAATWSGDGPGAIDPEKEANAAGKRMELGLSSLAEEKVAYDGGDWEGTLIQRRREVAIIKEAGLSLPGSSPAQAPQPAQAPNQPPPAQTVLPSFEINMPAPVVQYTPPDIHVAAPVVHYQPPEIHVAAPVVQFTPPVVQNEAPHAPAPRSASPAAGSAESRLMKVLRDSANRIVGAEIAGRRIEVLRDDSSRIVGAQFQEPIHPAAVD